MSKKIFTVEAIDWSCDSIWDAWLAGVFSCKDEADDYFQPFQSGPGTERFRVLEVEPDTNEIIEGWMVEVGEGELHWRDLDLEDKKFMGRG
jgi:hypothetical protein